MGVLRLVGIILAGFVVAAVFLVLADALDAPALALVGLLAVIAVVVVGERRHPH